MNIHTLGSLILRRRGVPNLLRASCPLYSAEKCVSKPSYSGDVASTMNGLYAAMEALQRVDTVDAIDLSQIINDKGNLTCPAALLSECRDVVQLSLAAKKNTKSPPNLRPSRIAAMQAIMTHIVQLKIAVTGSAEVPKATVAEVVELFKSISSDIIHQQALHDHSPPAHRSSTQVHVKHHATMMASGILSRIVREESDLFSGEWPSGFGDRSSNQYTNARKPEDMDMDTEANRVILAESASTPKKLCLQAIGLYSSRFRKDSWETRSMPFLVFVRGKRKCAHVLTNFRPGMHIMAQGQLLLHEIRLGNVMFAVQVDDGAGRLEVLSSIAVPGGVLPTAAEWAGFPQGP